ncbi:MAG: EscU/YscU/HrcU family type III secretion system export apparatus switch protein [Zoogloeaceae bacterium]|nr:EscU/YscU/HrcU family type III secretion system export apparatus switch protein [Zoogloeaceae bacterium]
MANEPQQPSRDEAVALTYTPGETAPRVVAKGRGLIAQEIIARAREAGVFVHESPELVGLLMQIDLDERIPPQLYVAIAELLAWLYKVEARKLPAENASNPRQTSGDML